jgi:polyisoprenoid-binding protein YceI
MKRKILPLAVALAAAITTASAVEIYEIDPVHSTVGFKIRHFFTDVPGRFLEFSGTINVDTENPEKMSTQAVIKASSIDTANAKRDEHLRSVDFFDVENHPEIRFETTKVEPTGEDRAKVTGNLTIHGVTKPVTMDAEFIGKGAGFEGEIRTGWKATTTINRKDFGLDWGKVVEGTAVVGDKVEIELNIEAVKKEDA